ncbi:MAG: hypothetical protein MH204_02815 [Fimbriimonadaceae bacterium]|nr:hypothetical protein [Fimbriimonadaceae bacterium]
MIVLAMVATLAAIAAPNLILQSRRGKEAELGRRLQLVRAALNAFHSDLGCHPTALAQLEAVTVTQCLAPNQATITPPGIVRGPYLPKVPLDPVSGAAFTYSPASGFTVGSSATGTDLAGRAYSTY